MADCIDREAVVDYIRYKVCQGEGNIEHRCQRGSCAYCGISEIMSDISCMPAADVQPINRWISVKDKLPEVGKVVIVCDKQVGVGAMELLSNGQWYHRGMAWSAEWILYWQPLPEPTKQ